MGKCTKSGNEEEECGNILEEEERMRGTRRREWKDRKDCKDCKDRNGLWNGVIAISYKKVGLVTRGVTECVTECCCNCKKGMGPNPGASSGIAIAIAVYKRERANNSVGQTEPKWTRPRYNIDIVGDKVAIKIKCEIG